MQPQAILKPYRPSVLTYPPVKPIHPPLETAPLAGIIKMVKEMDVANEILAKYNALFENLPEQGKGNLKFGRSLISVSAISGQYYCEKKLEMENDHPLPPSKRMIEGEAGHEAATSYAEPVTKEEGIALAVEEREEALPLFEFSIGWKYNSIPIIGRVDEAWFREGNVDLVVERKFSNRLTVYRDHHLQAQLYCLGLGEMGFNTDSTAYRIMLLKRSCRDCKELVTRSCPIFDINTTDFRCELGETRATIFPYNKEEIIRDLDWALGFWTGRREVIPTRNRAKCWVCEYANICDSALVK